MPYDREEHLKHSLVYSKCSINVRLSLMAIVIIGLFSIKVKRQTLINRIWRDIQIHTNNEVCQEKALRASMAQWIECWPENQRLPV